MATKDRVTIELYVDDQGTVKIRNAKVAVQELGPAGERSGQQLGSGLDYAASRAGSLATQLLALVGITVSVAGAGYLVKQAFSSWYGLISDGIGQVEELKKTIVGTSYILTSMSEVKPVDLGKTYDAWKDYFGWLHRASMEADKKAAASAQEIFTVGVELRKKGISIVSKEDVDTLGRLTDLMKAVTPAYASLANQVRGEVEAMMSGANRMGAQTAMVLSQIDPKFKENIANARRLGTEMEYFRSLLPSIRQYTFDMMGTWDSVSSSMKSAWSVVQVKAFGDAHKEVVSMVSQLTDKLMKNGELTKDGERLAEELSKTWSKARDKITDAIDYMIKNFPQIASDVGNIASGLGAVGGAAFRAATGAAELVKELRTVSQDPALMMILGAALGSRAGAIGAGVGAFAGLAISQQLKNSSEVERGLARQQAAGGVGGGGEAAETYYPLPPAGALGAAPPTPKTRPPGGTGAGAGSGGGGKGRDTTESLKSLLMQLRQEKAKLTEGAFAGVEAWADELNAKVRKLAMDDEQLKAGMVAVSKLEAAKEQKISDDLNKWYLGQMHQTTAAQLAEDGKKLDSVKGHAKEEAQVREVMAQHALERAAKLSLAEDQQQKTYLDSLAQSSFLITDQIAWKEKSWEMEKKIARAQLEQWFIGKDLSQGKKDEYRGLLALTNQAKEYNLARQKAVDLGTLEGWAIERAGEGLKRSRSTIKDTLTGVEGFFQDAFAQGVQGALSGDKKPFKEVGKTIVQSMILEMNKKTFTRIWDEIAKKLAPKPASTQGAAAAPGLPGAEITRLQQEAAKGSVDAAQKLTQASGNLSGASGELTGASGGLTDASGTMTDASGTQALSSVSLGLSAGGLALSAIGMISGSEELVMAGTVLQVAALAIEIASMALKVAAMIEAGSSWIPFFHGGGVVAHSGLLVAHGGLNLDERLIKAQVGEWVINKDATAEYARNGVSFDMVNGGRLPVAPVPVAVGGQGGGGAVTYDNKQVHFHIEKGAINIHPPKGMTDREAEQMVDRQILPVLEKKLANRGLSLLG